MTHIFLDPDKRGGRTLVDAAAVKVELEALEPPPHDGRDFGDPFMVRSYYPERSHDELSKLFGGEFAQWVLTLEPERWHGSARAILAANGIAAACQPSTGRPARGPVRTFNTPPTRPKAGRWSAGPFRSTGLRPNS